MDSTEKRLDRAFSEWLEASLHRHMRETYLFAKGEDLSFAQLATLHKLEHRGSCAVSDIGRSLSVSNAAVSQFLDKLVERDLIRRTELPGDRRQRTLEITESGRSLIHRQFTTNKSRYRRLLAMIPDEDREAVIHALTVLSTASATADANVPEQRR